MKRARSYQQMESEYMMFNAQWDAEKRPTERFYRKYEAETEPSDEEEPTETTRQKCISAHISLLLDSSVCIVKVCKCEAVWGCRRSFSF